MEIYPYRNYLHFLEKKPKISIFQKTILTFCAILLVIAGASSAFFYYLYKKEAPVRAENQYLETVTGGFFATKQSVGEVLDAFQVAGAKVKVIFSLKEASAAASGFSVSLDDTNRNISNIQTVRTNATFQKDQLAKMKVPQKFEKINQELLSFYGETISSLDELYKQHKLAKDLLISLGPTLYLPVLSNNTLWQVEKNEEIIAYYQNLKSEANVALASLSRLNSTEEFSDYIKTQTAYLEILVKTADDIINVLSQKDDPNRENPTQVEKAYQVLVGANKENDILSEKLLAQKLNLFSAKENSEKLAGVKIRQNSLEQKLNDVYASQPRSKIYQLPIFVRKIFKI